MHRDPRGLTLQNRIQKSYLKSQTLLPEGHRPVLSIKHLVNSKTAMQLEIQGSQVSPGDKIDTSLGGKHMNGWEKFGLNRIPGHLEACFLSLSPPSDPEKEDYG